MIPKSSYDMLADMTQPPEGWRRLASYVVSARIDAGFKEQRALAAAAGITERTLGKLERGERVSASTLAAVAKQLGWTPDSPQRIIEGGDPAAVSGAASTPPAPPQWPVSPTGPDPAELGPFEGEVWKEIALAGKDAPGSVMFPDSRVEAAAWDDLRLGDERARARLIARLRQIVAYADQSRQAGLQRA